MSPISSAKSWMHPTLDPHILAGKKKKHSLIFPIPGSFQGKVGWGLKQPRIVESIPVEFHDLEGAFKPKPFHDSKSVFPDLSYISQRRSTAGKKLQRFPGGTPQSRFYPM